MSELTAQPIATPGLESSVELEDGVVAVVLRGTADQEAVDGFTAFFGDLQKDVARLNVEEVKFDFRELEFLSASCFKRFAWWLEEVMSTGSPERVRFLSSSDHIWQRFSLNALTSFAEGRAVMEEDPSD